MAANKALQLPELVEPILLRLPTRDLLFAQKVCTTWKATIDTSHAIQKALFFMAGVIDDVDLNSNSQSALLELDSEHVAINALLINTSVVGRKDPFLLALQKPNTTSGSCSRMFLTQPPVTTRISFHIIASDFGYPISTRMRPVKLSRNNTFAALVTQYLTLVKNSPMGTTSSERASMELLLASPQAWEVDEWGNVLRAFAWGSRGDLRLTNAGRAGWVGGLLFAIRAATSAKTTQHTTQHKAAACSIISTIIITMAAARAFQLPKVIENIVLNLNTRDLLFAQKINKTSKTTIDTSLAIQKALFLAPGTLEDVSTDCRGVVLEDRSEVMLNPLLFRDTKVKKYRDLALFKVKHMLWPVEISSQTRMFVTQPPSPLNTRFWIQRVVWGTREGRDNGLWDQDKMSVFSGETFEVLVDELKASMKKLKGQGYRLSTARLDLVVWS
ncbi:hypothetical protein LTR17_012781 [Elasticomyces elasticus]|nr:hypothetical protein LTR17_012781 [Elasticomyces elasticus]